MPRLTPWLTGRKGTQKDQAAWPVPLQYLNASPCQALRRLDPCRGPPPLGSGVSPSLWASPQQMLNIPMCSHFTVQYHLPYFLKSFPQFLLLWEILLFFLITLYLCVFYHYIVYIVWGRRKDWCLQPLSQLWQFQSVLGGTKSLNSLTFYLQNS